MIEARGIVKSFGRRKVLDGLDLRVGDGEIVALVGPNGAGKTTLIKILATLIKPSSGKVILNENDVSDDPVFLRKQIGVMGHSTYTYDDLTPLENLNFFQLMNSIPRDQAENASKSMLERIGLAHRINDKVAVLSRGMRQRLAIARAIINSPQVLLLDEPFSSLDQRGVEILSKMLREERSKGRSILLVTHEISRLIPIIDRAEILLRGKIAHSFSAEQLARADLQKLYEDSIVGGIS